MPEENQFIIIKEEEIAQGKKDGTIEVLSDEEIARIRGEGEGESKEDKEQIQENVDAEVLNTTFAPFLKETYKIWGIDKDKIDTVIIKPELISPQNIDYKARKDDIDPSKFGEYTVNPDTQNIDFTKARIFTLPESEQQALEGKFLWEVAVHLRTKYGNTHYIPGIEYWKYLLDNPDSPQAQSLKDNKYHFNFGSLVRGSFGYWSVPYVRWNGSVLNRSGGWLGSTWGSSYRVLLLEKN